MRRNVYVCLCSLTTQLDPRGQQSQPLNGDAAQYNAMGCNKVQTTSLPLREPDADSLFNSAQKPLLLLPLLRGASACNGQQPQKRLRLLNENDYPASSQNR